MSEHQDPVADSMRTSAKRLLNLVTQVLACVLCIVVLLLPRRPISAPGWLAYLLALSVLVSLFFGIARILLFLDRRPRQRLAYRLLGVVLAVVPAASLLYLLFSHVDLLMRYFR